MRRKLDVQVVGPAYLDRVVRVDGPLAAPGRPPLDQSVDGHVEFGPGLVVREPNGSEITVEPPPGWPGPTGVVALSSSVGIGNLSVRGLYWLDDLGGMGAGFAAALGGELFCVLGHEAHPISRGVEELLRRARIPHRILRVSSRPTDWTLVVSSGPHGDKLPVGFRGCVASVGSLEPLIKDAGECDLRVVASFPNRLASQALRAPGAGLTLFAPTTRNMTDTDVPVRGFADAIDVLCCNRREWECLEDREQVGWQVSILAVTDGPNGSVVRFTTPQGEAGRLEIPAFPRTLPPRDTNRAGEAFAAALVGGLLDGGWTEGVAEPALVGSAAERAAAAAALVLDREDFGFPTDDEIDDAVRAGRVGPRDGVGEGGPRYNAGEDGDLS